MRFLRLGWIILKIICFAIGMIPACLWMIARYEIRKRKYEKKKIRR